jgi:hypothetical protein
MPDPVGSAKRRALAIAAVSILRMKVMGRPLRCRRVNSHFRIERSATRRSAQHRTRSGKEMGESLFWGVLPCLEKDTNLRLRQSSQCSAQELRTYGQGAPDTPTSGCNTSPISSAAGRFHRNACGRSGLGRVLIKTRPIAADKSSDRARNNAEFG